MINQDTVDSTEIIDMILQSTQQLYDSYDLPCLHPETSYHIILQKLLMNKGKKEAVSNN